MLSAHNVNVLIGNRAESGAVGFCVEHILAPAGDTIGILYYYCLPGVLLIELLIERTGIW